MKILGSEITPYKTYLNRRKFIKGSLASAMLATVTSSAFANHESDPSIYSKKLYK
jgi:secreted PhoX family phosphatase